MLKIGNLELNYPLILAPMSGISDLPFRLLNRKFGCELAFLEMVNARAIGYKSIRTERMLSFAYQDRPLGIQLLGCEPRFILRALDILNKRQFEILDFNAACPARKVTRRGEGASLLREPKKLKKILRIIVKNSRHPVSVKIRSGWNRDSLPAREIALYCQDAGINALFIHGRTKEQEYSGNVDYSAIQEVKKALRIPVIASGDIFSGQLAQKMFKETGCDGLTIARGAIGNPWIFQELTGLLKNGRIPPKPTLRQKIKVMLEHLNSCVEFHGQRIGVVLFRNFFSWYTKGFPGARRLREKAFKAGTMIEMNRIIQELNLPRQE
jgi:tRNA-dihydrouridine synthase B